MRQLDAIIQREIGAYTREIQATNPLWEHLTMTVIAILDGGPLDGMTVPVRATSAGRPRDDVLIMPVSSGVLQTWANASGLPPRPNAAYYCHPQQDIEDESLWAYSFDRVEMG